MSTESLSMYRRGSTATIAGCCDLSEEAERLIRNDVTPKKYVESLSERNLLQDAVRFLASALGKREAVWWACSCARVVTDLKLHGAQAGAIAAAERWVVAGTEEDRRATMPAAEAAKIGNAAGLAAMAAFFSGGSLAPPDVKPLPPAEDLTAKMAANAVWIGAVSSEPEKTPEKIRRFLTMGIEIAEGRNLWPDAT